MVRAALEEANAQLAFQPLHLLAQRRLHDVLPLRRPAEVQLLGQRHEVAKLPKLHTRRQVRIQPIARPLAAPAPGPRAATAVNAAAAPAASAMSSCPRSAT